MFSYYFQRNCTNFYCVLLCRSEMQIFFFFCEHPLPTGPINTKWVADDDHPQLDNDDARRKSKQQTQPYTTDTKIKREPSLSRCAQISREQEQSSRTIANITLLLSGGWCVVGVLILRVCYDAKSAHRAEHFVNFRSGSWQTQRHDYARIIY